MNQVVTLLKERFFTKAELGQTDHWSRGHRLVGNKTDRKGDSREDREREKSSGEFLPCHLA